MKLLRLLFLIAVVCALPACGLWPKKKKLDQSSARMYDGDSSPHIRMYDDVEAPGSLLHN